jgi:ABC-2 type transport system ATP-binding protein
MSALKDLVPRHLTCLGGDVASAVTCVMARPATVCGSRPLSKPSLSEPIMYVEPSSAQRECDPDSVSGHDLSLVAEASPDKRESATAVLQVAGLKKRYGVLEAVAGVTFNVHQGEVFGLLGLNGAGKTTLISLLATERRPSGGDALLFGQSIRDQSRAVRQMIGVAPQEIALYPMLTAAENLRFFGRIYGIRRTALASRVEELLHFVGLEDRANHRVATLSSGMQRRLNLAAALVHRPKLILLDEPTAGVDPQSRDQILKIVRRLRDNGNAILYTTHYMEEAEELCDRLGVLSEGKLIAVGTLEALLSGNEFAEIIEVAGLPAGIDLAALGALRGVCRVERFDGLLRLFVKRATDLLEPLQKLIRRSDQVRLKIAPLSLESLFLHLTGRKLGAGRELGE